VHREEHVAIDGLILRADDPAWDSIMPPNGYGCSCTVRQMTSSEADELGGESDAEDYDLESVPDDGWDFNPGKERKAWLDEALAE
jgi:uncharacterized protein with gpF-like domain